MSSPSYFYREYDVPLGIICIQKIQRFCFPRVTFNRELCYRTSVLVLTYLAYMCYHMTRKSISVVKGVLNQNCSSLTPPSVISPDEMNTWCDWAPFDANNAQALLGTLDSAFLFAYAIAMFMSGFVAERVNLRYFLSLGMLFSGIFSYLFGIAKSYNIHSLSYFIIVQIFAGIFQTTGWPGVVTVVGNWFGEGKRGLIYGIWNSHTSIGNIVGTLIAADYVESDWALSFMVPGLIMGIFGFILFLFLVVNPTDVYCASPRSKHGTQQHNGSRKMENKIANYGSSDDISSQTDDVVIDTEALIDQTDVLQRRYSERTPILRQLPIPTNNQQKAIGFVGALKIPGVIEYSLCLFFAKLVSYTFLYWLPLYIEFSSKMSAVNSAHLSTMFDVGGIAGAIIAGVVSDYSGMSATTCAGMLFAAVPMMFVYNSEGSSSSFALNILILTVVGLLVNGPYGLITTSVSAQLGTHSCLEGNAKALATVTAIIDGTGSIGAAIGPLLAGFVSNSNKDWQNVFYMLMISDILALLLLVRLVKREFLQLRPNHIE
ncbi:glucose-6-phosphate exchanger SLC37A2 [Chrysoperla carnea]|uniref:glucose-6-phosphate exchanger SLC37A2 n=1 Tax=Chrysoperla carnea TaxID=189513 RepID=UPI001D0669A4|nr:glucose-6-phosphate exchanger SLC37A2 [Chrysoperla carnea]